MVAVGFPWTMVIVQQERDLTLVPLKASNALEVQELARNCSCSLHPGDLQKDEFGNVEEKGTGGEDWFGPQARSHGQICLYPLLCTFNWFP